MGYPQKLLNGNESIVYEMRPHWRSLVFPVVALLLTVGIGSYLYAKAGGLDEGGSRSVLQWAIGLAALFVIVVWVIRPVVYWYSTIYVLTDHRIIIRTGIIARRGRDMPLSRVNDVSFGHTVIERFLNCGTLVVESAATQGQLVIANVPNVETIQREIYRLHDEDDTRRRRESDRLD
jgi:uncharacterized membrane protein YdbT with pleckstrin-like domain